MEQIMGNGQPGLIAKLEGEVETVKTDVSGIRLEISKTTIRVLWAVILLFVAILGAGNGTISLHALLQAVQSVKP